MEQEIEFLNQVHYKNEILQQKLEQKEIEFENLFSRLSEMAS